MIASHIPMVFFCAGMVGCGGSARQISAVQSVPATERRRESAALNGPAPITAAPTQVVRIQVDEKQALSTVGAITDLVLAVDPTSPEQSVVAIGTRGAAWLTLPSLTVIREVSFGNAAAGESPGPPIARCAFDVNADGVPEAIERLGSYPIDAITVRSTLTGELVWRYSAESQINMIAPLRDPQNGARVIVGCRSSIDNGEKSFDLYGRILDGSGQLLERQRWADRDGAHIEHQYLVIDIDRDGRDELLYGNAGELLLRDSAGKLLWHERPLDNSRWVQFLNFLPARSQSGCVIGTRVTATGFMSERSRNFSLELTVGQGKLIADWTERSAAEAQLRYWSGTGTLVADPRDGANQLVLLAAPRSDVPGANYIRASTTSGELVADYKLRTVDGGSTFTGCGTLLLGNDQLLVGWGPRLFVVTLAASPAVSQP